MNVKNESNQKLPPYMVPYDDDIDNAIYLLHLIYKENVAVCGEVFRKSFGANPTTGTCSDPEEVPRIAFTNNVALMMYYVLERPQWLYQPACDHLEYYATDFVFCKKCYEKASQLYEKIKDVLYKMRYKRRRHIVTLKLYFDVAKDEVPFKEFVRTLEEQIKYTGEYEKTQVLDYASQIGIRITRINEEEYSVVVQGGERKMFELVVSLPPTFCELLEKLEKVWG